MRFIQLYGHYRTGTNYVDKLLRLNTRATVLSSVMCHKHSPSTAWIVPDDYQYRRELLDAIGKQRVSVAVIVKHPYGMLYSFAKLRQINLQGRDKSGQRRDFVVRICERINSTYAAWMSSRSPWHDRLAVITYESLLGNLDAALRPACDFWGIALNKPVKDFTSIIAAGKIDTQRPHDRRFWRRRKYLEHMSSGVLASIKAEIDWDLFERLGDYSSSLG